MLGVSRLGLVMMKNRTQVRSRNDVAAGRKVRGDRVYGAHSSSPAGAARGGVVSAAVDAVSAAAVAGVREARGEDRVRADAGGPVSLRGETAPLSNRRHRWVVVMMVRVVWVQVMGVVVVVPLDGLW